MCPADPYWNWLRGDSLPWARSRHLNVGMSRVEAKTGWMELETRCGMGQTETRPQRSWQVETIGWGAMGESRCGSQIASMTQTGRGCHGNRDRSKGQNLESKPGQSKMVSEARARAKGCTPGVRVHRFPLNAWLLLCCFCSCSLHRELSGPGVP